jgi:hypothetical protein
MTLDFFVIGLVISEEIGQGETKAGLGLGEICLCDRRQRRIGNSGLHSPD